jgi:hypothetical protein
VIRSTRSVISLFITWIIIWLLLRSFSRRDSEKEIIKQDRKQCYSDTDKDGVIDILEDANHDWNLENDDVDDDGIPNYLDKDDDDDWIFTLFEDTNLDWNPYNDDLDGDWVPNFMDDDDDWDWIKTLDQILASNDNLTKEELDKLMKELSDPKNAKNIDLLDKYMWLILHDKDQNWIADYLNWLKWPLLQWQTDMLKDYTSSRPRLSNEEKIQIIKRLTEWSSIEVYHIPNRYQWWIDWLKTMDHRSNWFGWNLWNIWGDPVYLSNSQSSSNNRNNLINWNWTNSVWTNNTAWSSWWDRLWWNNSSSNNTSNTPNNNWVTTPNGANNPNPNWGNYITNWWGWTNTNWNTKNDWWTTNWGDWTNSNWGGNNGWWTWTSWNVNGWGNWGTYIPNWWGGSNWGSNNGWWTTNWGGWTSTDNTSKPFADYYRCANPFWWLPLEHWKSVFAYKALTAEYPSTCEWEERICNNWTLLWTFDQKTCIQIWKVCTSPWWTTIKHWDTVTTYQNNIVPYW